MTNKIPHFIEEMLEKGSHLWLFFFQIHDLLYLCKKNEY